MEIELKKKTKERKKNVTNYIKLREIYKERELFVMDECSLSRVRCIVNFLLYSSMVVVELDGSCPIDKR